MSEAPLSVRTQSVLVAAVFLVALAVYVLTGPGRIDSIDGQFRFDIAVNLVVTGLPEIRDPVLVSEAIVGPDSHRYFGWGPAPSYLAVPLVFAGKIFGDPFAELGRFLFSFLNSILVAAAVGILCLLFLELGVGAKKAATLALSVAFGSLLWIGATTVLEQGQHALFALLGLYLAWRSARRKSAIFALAAGLAAGTLSLYQFPYVILLPFLALATFRTPEAGEEAGRWKENLGRYVTFGIGSAISVGTAMLYNFNRLGTLIFDPRDHLGTHPPIEGNPLVGVASLLLSPGKGLLFFSPIVILFALGFGSLLRRDRWLGTAALAAASVHLLFVGSLSIFHGDWCWGPRYLIVITPLLALGLPFALEGASRRRRAIASALVAWGVFSNLLGLALIHERFFIERGLPKYFWHDNSAFYWKHSAHLDRIREIAETVRSGVPPEAAEFSCTQYSGLLTYFLMACGPPGPDPPWIRQFRIFYLPRPWPLWLYFERDGWARGRGFPGYWFWVGGFSAIGLAGGWLLRSTLRRLPDETAPG